MNGFLQVMLIAALPAAGNLLGSGLAVWMKPAKHTVGISLHAAAGIAIGIVAVELMPRAMELGDTAAYILVIAFLVGALVSILLASLINKINSAEKAGPWRVLGAVGIDLFSDGIMIGIGSSVSTGLGLILGVSQVVGNVPGGFASISNLRGSGYDGKKNIIPILLLPVPALLGAVVGFMLLRDAAETSQAIALVFVAGLLLLPTLEDTLPEGDAPTPPRKWTGIAVAAGFAFILIASDFAK